MTLREILTEAKTVSPEDFGYTKQTAPVVDGHVTYTSSGGKQILIDVSAKEWHFMNRGVVTEVGKTTDGSLRKLLDK